MRGRVIVRAAHYHLGVLGGATSLHHHVLLFVLHLIDLFLHILLVAVHRVVRDVLLVVVVQVRVRGRVVRVL